MNQSTIQKESFKQFDPIHHREKSQAGFTNRKMTQRIPTSAPKYSTPSIATRYIGSIASCQTSKARHLCDVPGSTQRKTLENQGKKMLYLFISTSR
ncbi:hypothetical protein NC652_041068 [Populus alba x Populus x berolinensis]|nr:hypothetical protein NC652_041068 [Populus alba x Populus x berolinensis]